MRLIAVWISVALFLVSAALLYLTLSQPVSTFTSISHTATSTLLVLNTLGCLLLVVATSFLIVDRKKQRGSSRRMQQPSEWFQVTLSSIGDAVIATDNHGRITFLNTVAETLTGWNLEAAQGQPLEKVFHVVNETTRQPVENPALRAIKEGVIVGLANHTVLVARDGRETVIDDSAAPIRSNGETIGAVLVFRDTSERRKAEQTSALLSGIVESSDDAIISKSLDGTILTWNNAAERLFEYSADEVIGKHITVIIPRDRLHEEQIILERLRKGGRIDHYETIRVSKSGKLIDISLTVSPIRNSEGEIIGASKIGRDITARKLADEALRQQREWLQVTLSSIGDAVIATDMNGIVTFLNPVAASLTGWSREEAKGRPLDEVFRIVNETTRQPVENPALRAIREGTIVGLANHTMLIAKDGSEIAIDDSGAPIRATGGDLLGSVLIFRDITERRLAEEERTRLLASERAAREQAEAASRAKDEFVATISHEIRSPLNAIVGWAQMLSTGKLDQDETARAIETITRNARIQVKLIEDLLDISRVITGKLNLSFRAVDPQKVVEAALDSIRPAAEAKSIQIDLDLEASDNLVSADPDRLQQICWNLLSNAVKFTPRHGRIGVQMQRVDSRLEFTVKDSGAGIAPEFLPFVFDRFSQANTTTERKYGGLGLGLAIARHLVEMHGGAIRAESPGEGQGATFTVAIPLRVVRENPKDSVERLGGPDGLLGSAPALLGLRLLVLDDEAETRELLTTMLQEKGAEVRECATADEALATIEQWQPHVVVSDIGMPGEDGYSFIKRLRALEAQRGWSIPAVALTAYARSEDRMRALAAGFRMHVTKPVEALELIVVIASLTGRTAAGA
ncbi:MAG TPA: PAS domain S-box protein [Pyrinomonadaceae bacterium]|nr:PAS domain S-box protein [Pyrinomonadaceae bacterium]